MVRAAMIAVVGLVTVAAAPPKVVDPVVAAKEAMAEADFDKALSLLDAGLPKARTPAEFSKLHLMRGEALVALQRLDEAAEAFSAALTADPQAELDRASVSPDAVSALAKARQQFSSDFTVLIFGGAKADVRLDDAELGPAPLKTRVGPGKHRLEAVAADGQRVTRLVEVLPSKPLEVTLEFPVALAPSPPPPPGATAVRIAPHPGTSRPKAALLPLGVGVVALGVGVGLALDSAGKYAALKQEYDRGSVRSDFEAEVAAGRTEQTIGFVVGGVGVAAAVGGALWYFLGSTTPSVAVYGSTTGVGLSASWELP